MRLFRILVFGGKNLLFAGGSAGGSAADSAGGSAAGSAAGSADNADKLCTRMLLATRQRSRGRVRAWWFGFYMVIARWRWLVN
eukprot:gene3783-6305_t